MSLAAGTRLGSYEIVGLIGAGGMGEVYRARDTKLNRDVAIKLLPDLFAADGDRLARFTREAQTLAALNHPNIAQIHGFEDRALVMELVSGEDLSTIVARGPMPPAEALQIARQIVDALEAAHEQGIVHRDLKPANVKVREDGTVKVLDFGLAKAADPAGGSDGSIANSPTLTVRATQMGLVLGTAAYMAPEQAKGRPVDKRADIWAFGVVLYEMLTGRGPFLSDTIPETLAYVMTRDVDFKALPADTPRRVRKLIAHCLVRDPKKRLRDIGDARLILDEPEEAAPQPGPGRPAPTFRDRLLLPAALVLFLLGVAALVLSYLARSGSESQTTLRLSIALPPGEQVTTPPAISRDGRMIAYSAGRSASTSRLYLRRLEAYGAQAVDSGAAATYPFFSPDGQSIAFFAENKLWRASVGGGAATAVAPAPRGWGGTWGDDNRIVYVPSLNAGLWRVAAKGGTPEQLTQPDGDAKGYAHVFPQALPGGNILFTFWGRTFYNGVLKPGEAAWSNATGAGTRSSTATYAANGHLLVGDLVSNLRAARWRPEEAPTANVPDTVVLENVNWLPGTERYWIAVSDSGTAVVVPGNPSRRHLAWIDRQGQVTQLSGEPDLISHGTISRDGRRVVYNGRESQWVRDVVTGSRTKISSERASWTGGWFPGDDRIVISSNRTGDWDLYTVPSSGGDLTPLLKQPRSQHPLAVAPDGSVLFLDNDPVTGNDIWTLTPDGKVSPLVVTPYIESAANVSPDGRYVAYQSNESGRNEVYAIPFSGKGERATVSIDGGTGPVWSRDGRELFYRAGDHVMSIDVRSTNPLTLGERHTLVDVSGFDSMYFHEFDVSADGRRFLFLRAEPDARPTRLDVIVNWFPELAKKVAGK
jgi:serine/threonine protein kinase/Tol biopolymer transport system component